MAGAVASRLWVDVEAEVHAALVGSATWQCAIHKPGCVTCTSRSTVWPVGTSTVFFQVVGVHR